MKKHLVKPILASLLVVLIIAASAIGFLAWVYSGPVTPTKISLLKSLSLPVGRVGFATLDASEVLQRQNLVERSGKSISFSEAMALSIHDIQIDQLTTKYKARKDKRFEQLVNDGLESRDGTAKVREKMGLSKTEFERLVISPYIHTLDLQLYFVGKEELHTTEYSKATKMIQLLKSGKEFGDASVESKIANKNSETASLSGDTGYVPLRGLLPELQYALSSNDVGEPKLIVTRNGLYVVIVTDWLISKSDTPERVSVKTAFVPVAGYKEWVKQALKSVPASVYIKE